MLQEKFEQSEVAMMTLRSGAVGVTRGMGAAPTKSSTGVWVATLSQGIPSANCRTIATPVGGGGDIFVTHTSDTVKTISTLNTSGAAADIDFDVSFAQILAT